MKIDNKTLQYALSVLDTQHNHCMNKLTATETQKAYYEGLKTMLDIILSDSYKKKCFVGRDYIEAIYTLKVSKKPKIRRYHCV